MPRPINVYDDYTMVQHLINTCKLAPCYTFVLIKFIMRDFCNFYTHIKTWKFNLRKACSRSIYADLSRQINRLFANLFPIFELHKKSFQEIAVLLHLNIWFYLVNLYSPFAVADKASWKWSECSRSNLTEIYDLCLLNQPTDIWKGSNRSICGNYIVEAGNCWKRIRNY